MEGLRGRTVPELNINTLWVCSWTQAPRRQKMWIDDIHHQRGAVRAGEIRSVRAEPLEIERTAMVG